MMSRDRRKNTRVPFQTTADVVFPNAHYNQCATENLSVKGVSVLGVSGHAIGETCDLSLELSGSSSQLRLAMKGTIVRVDTDRIALNFTEIDIDSFYHLKNIIYYNSSDPDSIEEELIN
ncbi:MAG: PilZ domain-containing protein [Proteobacteria bacterium]|nr:PilZ domain-containing protein [Desulfobulbaceae bacterium]MBU4151697.1 PilZ domain-containing protein [Pseudomonadota bacterium]